MSNFEMRLSYPTIGYEDQVKSEESIFSLLNEIKTTRFHLYEKTVGMLWDDCKVMELPQGNLSRHVKGWTPRDNFHLISLKDSQSVPHIVPLLIITRIPLP
jgi:hypothetical protein